MKVFLRFPVYSHLCKETSAWWASLMYQMGLAKAESNNEVLPGIEIISAEIHCSTAGPDRARNDIVRSFLKTDATHLWMIDSDVCPPKNLVLLDVARVRDTRVLSGVYYLYNDLRGTKSYPNTYKLLGNGSVSAFIPSNPGPLSLEHFAAVGAGCILIERGVLEAMGPPWFSFGETEEGELLGEDFMFCRRVGGADVYTPYLCEHFKVAPLSLLQ